MKLAATILFLLGIFSYVQAKPIYCYEDSLSNACELTFNIEGSFESFYYENLYVSATQQPIFKEKSVVGMNSSATLIKLGDKYLFEKSNYSIGTHSDHVLVMEYLNNELTVIQSLYIWDDFNNNIVPNQSVNYGKQCELNMKVRTDYEEYGELFSDVAKLCDELIRPYEVEMPIADDNSFYIQSYENNKVYLKKVFFPNEGKVLLELACIENCSTKTNRYFGKIDNKYPFILEYDLTSPKNEGEYYYLKYENPIAISGRQSNGEHTLYALGANKVKTESFVFTPNKAGYQGLWTHLKTKKSYPVYLYPMVL